MDDDDSGEFGPLQRRSTASHSRSTEGNQGKQGSYQLPQSGVCWVWHRDGAYYTGLSVRDIGAKLDICSFDFVEQIKSASKMKGRRSNTVLPDEDRFLLRGECVDGNAKMTFQSGTVAYDCIPKESTIKDVEHLVRLTCPWDRKNSHWLEIQSALQRLGRKPTSIISVHPGADSCSLVAVSSATGPGAVETTQSEIDKLIGSIRHVLHGLNQQEALSNLSQLNQLLEVTC